MESLWYVSRGKIAEADTEKRAYRNTEGSKHGISANLLYGPVTLVSAAFWA
jgi:hypothetical protein